MRVLPSPRRCHPCGHCSVMQFGDCECAGLPRSCTCRPTVPAVRPRGKVPPPRCFLPPGKETPLPPRGRGVGGRSARKAPNSSAGTAQVRSSSAAAAAGAALWAKCGTAARRSRAGSEPSGAPSYGRRACAVLGSSVAARRERGRWVPPTCWPPGAGGTGSCEAAAAAGSRSAGGEPGQGSAGQVPESRQKGRGDGGGHPPGAASGHLPESPELPRPRSARAAAPSCSPSPEACAAAAGSPRAPS